MDNRPNRPSGLMSLIQNIAAWIFKHGSSLVDRLLFSKSSSVIFSLFMAIIICFSIDYDDISIRLLNDTTTTINLAAVEVEVLADTDTYEVSGIPNTVDVTLTGDATDIQVFRQQGNFKVIADLRKYKEGTNIIDLKMESLPSNIEAKINPDTVNGVLSKKETVRFPLEVQLLVGSNQKLEDFKVEELSSDFVEITASQETLSSIRVVKAIVDVTGQIADFEAPVKLVAYDSDGNKVSVVMSPTSINAIVRLAD